MREIVHKYTDKNHKPVPELKVGDRCYTHCPWDSTHYDYVSTCEIRKVEVVWIEPDEYFGRSGYWSIDYYIRTDVDRPYLMSTKRYAYHLDEGLNRIYRTPQEVMDDNIRRFKESVMNAAVGMRKTMRRLGYTEEQEKKLLEYKNEEGGSGQQSDTE